jgi:glycosyltransferase involved in cell wall biosynthesis
VRDLRPDLVHIIADPWVPTAEGGAAAARHAGIPYTLVGTSLLGGAKGLAARWQANRVRDEAAGLGGINRPALDFLAREAPAGPRVVTPHLGFTIPGDPPGEDPVVRPLTIGVIGRVVPERGIDMLLDALSGVHGEWRVKIVGTGPAQEPLERQAQRLGLSSRMEWLGGLPRTELAPIWAAIDVLVAPSRSTAAWAEPTGSLVLEAMARRRAVVVSRSGALPDVVSDAGLVVDEGDTEALARAITRLVREPEFAGVLGSRGRERVLQHYGDGPIAERMAAFWKEATGNG